MKAVQLISLVMLVAVASGQVDPCEDGDGILNGCHACEVCIDGNPVFVECPREDDLVCDPVNLGQCMPFVEDDGPCGASKDCSDLPNIDLPLCEFDCEWYASCFEGKHAGNTKCNPGTVFDSVQQICNWPEATCAPCGEKDGNICNENICDVGEVNQKPKH